MASAVEYTARAEVLHNGRVIAERKAGFTLAPEFEMSGIWGKSGDGQWQEAEGSGQEAEGSGQEAEGRVISFDIGKEGRLRFRIKNVGTAEGEAVIHLKLLDLVDEEKRVWLGIGEEKEVEFTFLVPDDLEDKEYEGEYKVISDRLSVIGGRFSFHINGVKIKVEASLDKQLYEEGEMAKLTIEVTNLSALGYDLSMYARVNFNDYEARQDFVLKSIVDGPQSIVLGFDDIPVRFTGQKIGYAIYMASGRSIYINSMYIREKGKVISLWTDKDVYNAGEEVRIRFMVHGP